MPTAFSFSNSVSSPFQFPPCGAVDFCNDGGTCQSGAAAVKSKVWAGRQVLRVYFMNPEVLEGWKCEGKRMTPEMVMKWAGAWQQASSAPQFTVTSRVQRADIRVKFSGKSNFDCCTSLESLFPHSQRQMLFPCGYAGSCHYS